MSPNPAAINTRPATIDGVEFPPVNGSGAAFVPATVVDEPPSVATASETSVVDVSPATVVVAPAVVAVGIVVVDVVTADDEVVS